MIGCKRKSEKGLVATAQFRCLPFASIIHLFNEYVS